MAKLQGAEIPASSAQHLTVSEACAPSYAFPDAMVASSAQHLTVSEACALAKTGDDLIVDGRVLNT